MCGCKPGFVNNNDGYGCVDETPPILKLRHDPRLDKTLRLKQGDVYEEYAVDIIDENAEDYLRELRISYSQPLPLGCLVHVGEFHVNYTVATPWTTPPYVRVTRHVIVEDVDECSLNAKKLRKTCPALIQQCDTAAGAVCKNTIGSYTCECPKYTKGDGFLSDASFIDDYKPVGYQNGSSCTDSSIPTIQVLGPNPKVFKVCKCDDLIGTGAKSNVSKISEVCQTRRKFYKNSIKDSIAATGGAALCSTHSSPSPSAGDCVRASDQTYRGAVDITDLVTIGEPVEKSPLHFEVPYDVVDKAGNAARAWRKVVVEEVDLATYEQSIREEMIAQKDRDIKAAVEDALKRERRKKPETTCPDVSTSHRTAQQQQQQCNCPAVTAADCERFAEKDCPTLASLVTRFLNHMQLFESSVFGVVVFLLLLLAIRLVSFAIRSIGQAFGIGGNNLALTTQHNRDTGDEFLDARDRFMQTPVVETIHRAPFSDSPRRTTNGDRSAGGFYSPEGNGTMGSPYLSRRLDEGSVTPTPYSNGNRRGGGGNTRDGYDDSIYQ